PPSAPSSALDEVALDGVHSNPKVAGPVQGPADLLLRAVQLQDDPAIAGGHVSPADVRHDRELVPELIDDRLANELRRQRELDASDPHYPTTAPRSRSAASNDSIVGAIRSGRTT